MRELFFLAPPYVSVWSPGFHVEPASYVTVTNWGMSALNMLHLAAVIPQRNMMASINVKQRRDRQQQRDRQRRKSGQGKERVREKDGLSTRPLEDGNGLAKRRVVKKAFHKDSRPKKQEERNVDRTTRRRQRRKTQRPIHEYFDNLERQNQGLLRHSEEVALAMKIRDGMKVERIRERLKTRERKDSVDSHSEDDLADVAKILKVDEKTVHQYLLEGIRAKRELVARNLGLVRKVASLFYHKQSWAGTLALDDLIQEGSLGLIRAAEKFEPDRGYRFSTYATWWVKASVLRAMGSQTKLIRIPSTVVEEHGRIRRAHRELMQKGISRPSEEEIANAVGITVGKLRFTLEVVGRQPSSLDLKLLGPPRGSRTLGDIVPGDEDVELELVEDMQRRELDKTLKQCLIPQERAIIRLRFGLEDGHPRTLREIGALIGYSKERVRQIIYTALNKLKTREMRDALVDFLS